MARTLPLIFSAVGGKQEGGDEFTESRFHSRGRARAIFVDNDGLRRAEQTRTAWSRIGD